MLIIIGILACYEVGLRILYSSQEHFCVCTVNLNCTDDQLASYIVLHGSSECYVNFL